MTEYFIEDLQNYYDTVEIIENKGLSNVSLVIKNDISHCHKLSYLADQEISIVGLNKPEYNIYIESIRTVLISQWKFNTSNFSYYHTHNINFRNLHFTYFIEQNGHVIISYDYDEKTDRQIEIIALINKFYVESFGIILMEFSSSTMEFKDCTFENNTNKTFEIIAKKNSNITFINCLFDGDFIFDITSKISMR
jgi:hypothetical protein